MNCKYIWKIIDGNLYYGYDTNMTIPKTCNYSIYNKKDLKIKTSDDNKYCAVYNEDDLYCDFYTHEYYPDNWRRNLGKYLFTLRRDPKHANNKEKMIIEFVKYNNKQYFLFHTKSRTIDIRDMENNIVTQRLLSTEFIQNIERVNDEYFILRYWTWHPFNSALLINFKELMENKNPMFPVIWNEPEECIYNHSLYTVCAKNGKIHYNVMEKLPIVDENFLEYERLNNEGKYDSAYELDDPNDDFMTYPKLDNKYLKYDDCYEFEPEYVKNNCITDDLFKIFLL